MYFLGFASIVWLPLLTKVSDAWKCSTCSIWYEAVGCYKDNNIRPLPTEILNERDPTRDIYDGHSIDWYNWDEYMEAFACRCAAKAKERGWSVFGLQFYGECWSGEDLESYKSVGKSSDCIGSKYAECQPTDRHCVGKQFTNMVYRIVPECGIKFEQVGCYHDPHTAHEPHPLPDQVLTDRDASDSIYSGFPIDWRSWDAYLPNLACRCAHITKNKGFDTFGLQFYGECWSGNQTIPTYMIKGLSSNCINQCYDRCTRYNKFCSGVGFTNFVYRLSEAPCELSMEEVGCFAENSLNRALDKEILNEAYPPNPLFNGNLLNTSDWNTEFPKMLCRCARAAKDLGFDIFGVHDHGSCWSGNDAVSTYNKHGESTECFKNYTLSCEQGNLACAGGPKAQFVYRIV